jgi:hypothetical protein
MATKKTGVLVGIAAIAVIGVAAVIYFSQWPPAEEDATGAIGAAERYRAEQITDEDVILDIPGQEQLAETVFEVLTEEQKAELLGRAAASERGIDFKKFEANEAAFERWTAVQRAGFAKALNLEARADLAAAMKFEAKDFDAMRAENVAEKISSLDMAARQRAFERFQADEEAFQRWSVAQKASFARVLNNAARAELAAAMKFEAKDFDAMRAENVAEKISSLNLAARQRAFERFQANEEAFQRWSAAQKASFARVLNNAARAELAAAMKVDAADLATMRAETVAERFDDVGVEARARTFERFQADEEAFQRWSVAQKASFARILSHDARAELAAAMKFDAKDFDAMRAAIVAEKLSGLNLAARQRAFERFGADQADFERWTVHQRAGYSDLLGAKGLEHALLRRGTFDRLTQAQQRTVWSRLGSDGQFAALRYAGLEASVARGNSLERGEQFERILAERGAQE